MKGLLTVLLLTGAALARAQGITEAQQKSINQFITYFNECTKQVSGLGPSLVQPYRQYADPKARSSWAPDNYTCRITGSDYYFEEGQKLATALGSVAATFLTQAQQTRKTFKALDQACKDLEIYYRLKDFEKDQYNRVHELVMALVNHTENYSREIDKLQTEVNWLKEKLQPATSSAYGNADQHMRDQLALEKTLIDKWSFNVRQAIHSGWPVEAVQQHIRDDQTRLPALRQLAAGIAYPASSMVQSFIKGVESIQDVKRNGVDGYTYEKYQSDEHTNTVYGNLLNHYNSDCLAFYNNYIQSASTTYRGFYYLMAVPRFQVRSDVKMIDLTVKPFRDVPVEGIKPVTVNTPISPAVHNALTYYILFINEGMRQINFMSTGVRNLNSSTASAIARLNSGNTATLRYYHNTYQLPVTLYQQTVDQSKAIPNAYQASLLKQAEVLYDILNELNQWNNKLLAESAARQLGKDNPQSLYAFFDRYIVLIQAFDERKEKLFHDVRNLYDVYAVANPKNSWQVSGSALWMLVQEDFRELMKARDYFIGKPADDAQTQRIEELSRDLIVNEFSNLSGIQKLGRNNGLCPYTPYEDLAENSRRFGEALLKVRQRSATSSRHPYSELIYQYNQVLVESYNKFVELSKMPLLKQVIQLDWYSIIPPAEPVSAVTAVVSPATNQEQPTTPKVNQTPTAQQQGTQPRNTRDTVYITRIDTVYVGRPGEDLHSMEGYATNHLILLVDVSASMNQAGRFPLLKQTLYQLMEMMRPEDKLSIITYSGKARTVMMPTSFTEKAKIKTIIDQLKPEGKTDGNSGIKMAYDLADENYLRGGNNRIILATDGEFPMGKSTFELARKFAADDIVLSVFNFGKSDSAAKNLRQLAAEGKGNYVSITEENAEISLIREVKAKRKS